jgi:ATP-dependent DNA helicase RecQ
LAFLESHRDRAGILYCSTRKQVDDLAAELQARGWPALPYHAGLPNDERQRNQDRFIRDDATLMVATVAFGLGIDKSNVRFVLHYQLPKDLESYYPEVGRAGRDGLPADCLLLHSRADAVTIRRFIEEGAASERPGRQARLDALMRYAQTTGCRRAPLLAYFGETHSGACGHCDNCRAAPDPADLADVTVAAQKFLSCVKRTGELFGPAHIIDVLRGSRSQRIVERGHDRLSTHGIGAELSKEEWRELAGRFLEQGLVEQDLQYGGLRLTAKAWPVLKGAKVFAPRLASTPAPAAPAPALAMPAAHDRALFEELRRLRRQLADAANVPAYVVFSDRALTEMAARLPQNAGQFLAVNGVGEAKLAKYGETFLATIRQFCAARGIDPAHGEPANAPAPPEPPATRWVTALRRCERIAEAFAAGRTLDELTAQFGIRRSTALDHLARFVDQGGRLDPARLLAESRLSPAERERAVAAFAKLGLDRLAPVREALGAAVSYDELHLLRLSLRCQGTS